MLTFRGWRTSMAWRTSMLFILAVLTAVSVWSEQINVAQQDGEGHVVPLKTFPPGQRFETVSGDPAKSGEPFVIRIHAEAGYIIMPHTHPVDENIVVVKGSWAVGMGDRFNRQALEPMEVGTYALVPKTMAHFALSKTDTIIQVHGIGPFPTPSQLPIYTLTHQRSPFH